MSESSVSNNEVILWALYELGGSDHFVDVEDVFLRAFELAPIRFSWRTRKDLVDYKKCSLALGALGRQVPRPIVNQGEYFRMVSVEGQKWIEENFDRLADELGKDRDVKAPRSRSTTRLVTQILKSELYEEWRQSGELPTDKWKVALMLRCSPDSARAVYQERIETLRSAAYASGHTEILEFLDQLKAQRREWF
jgi:hypothetical protein